MSERPTEPYDPTARTTDGQPPDPGEPGPDHDDVGTDARLAAGRGRADARGRQPGRSGGRTEDPDGHPGRR